MRAGSNGFTNVVIEFNAESVIDFAGHLVAQMQSNEQLDLHYFGGVFDQASEETGAEFSDVFIDGDTKIEFVKNILLKVLENHK